MKLTLWRISINISVLFYAAGLQTLNITARRRLIQQNAASVKSMLQALNQQLKKQTGYSLDEYINLILDKIETSYESETFLESTDMVDAVERIRNVY